MFVPNFTEILELKSAWQLSDEENVVNHVFLKNIFVIDNCFVY